jgi:hypothetical protein
MSAESQRRTILIESRHEIGLPDCSNSIAYIRWLGDRKSIEQQTTTWDYILRYVHPCCLPRVATSNPDLSCR